MAGNFTFGIEEEYFLVDARDQVGRARHAAGVLRRRAQGAPAGASRGEFLQSQIEVVSSPHTSMAEARKELRGLRQTLAAVAADHGLAFLAAGTHPTAVWGDSCRPRKSATTP